MRLNKFLKCIGYDDMYGFLADSDINCGHCPFYEKCDSRDNYSCYYTLKENLELEV